MPVVCGKLVRDRIPEIIQSEGRRTVTRVLDAASYRQALLAKLIEEAKEASHATADDLPGELADVLEVLRALTVTAGISWSQLLALAKDKRRRRGGFGRRIFLESVERGSSMVEPHTGAMGHAYMPNSGRSCSRAPDTQRRRLLSYEPALDDAEGWSNHAMACQP